MKANFFREPFESVFWLSGMFNASESRWRWENGDLVVFERWETLHFKPIVETSVPAMKESGHWEYDLLRGDAASVTCEKEYGK